MEGVTGVTRLLPVACILAAVCLFASELMTAFEFTPPGGEALCDQVAGDRHSNAQIVIAVFAIAATLIAVYSGSRPAAIAVGVMGGLALLIFLISDLRVVNATGSLNDSCATSGQAFFSAEAVPQGGFWLEMLGALGLAVTGITLATMTPEQLAGFRPRRPVGPRTAREAPFDAETEGDPAAPRTDEDPHRLPRRPRSRQRG
jgi:hypothetical protein